MNQSAKKSLNYWENVDNFILKYQYWLHFLLTMYGPVSWYYCLVIHFYWNVDNDVKIEPPNQVKIFLSYEAATLIFMVDGERLVTSLLSL